VRLEGEGGRLRPDHETGSNPIFGAKRGTNGMVEYGAGLVDYAGMLSG